MTYAERSPLLEGKYVTLESPYRTLKSSRKELLEVRCSQEYDLLRGVDIKLNRGYLYYEVKLLSAG